MRVRERYAGESARDYALNVLKDNIISLDLIPGSVVSEKELADQLGVSRTPVREALIELGKNGIVEIYPQKGSNIALIDTELVEEARFVRKTLEIAIVESLCDIASPDDIIELENNLKLQEFYLNNSLREQLLKLDNEFHKQLFKICKKERTYDLMHGFTIHFDRVRNLSLSAVKDIKIVSDHKGLVEAISKKDKVAAKDIIEKHLNRYKFADEQMIRKAYPTYFKN